MKSLFNDTSPDPDQSEPQKPAHKGYVLAHQTDRTIQPLHKKKSGDNSVDGTTGAAPDPHKNAAIELIRKKLETVYEDEPDAEEELEKAEDAPQRSPHQQVMYELSNSGRSRAEIQEAWHAYYAGLSDAGKHEVWREFYANDQQPGAGSAYKKAAAKHAEAVAQQDTAAAASESTASATGNPADSLQLHPEAEAGQAPQAVIAVEHEISPPVAEKTAFSGKGRGRRALQGSTQAIRKHVVEKVKLSAAQQEKAKQHAHSLLFGLSFGAVVIVIFLFSFFNEIIIAPFIQPSRTVSSTPIILTSDSVAAGDTPEVIIPKINVQIPVDYTQQTVDEESIQNSLENGVVHYASTNLPGEQGNTAIFGHSSNNIFNKGKYKFAFVKLNELVPGDTFYLTKDKKIYTYRVYDKRVVEPSETEVLRPVDDKVTATLITCDPPGTSKHRLVVWGEQISPDPATASVAAAPATETASTAEPVQLSDNGPTLWKRFTNWLL